LPAITQQACDDLGFWRQHVAFASNCDRALAKVWELRGKFGVGRQVAIGDGLSR
jgi:hypothetical protein